MNKHDAALAVNKDFVYTSDKGESWNILKPDSSGKLRGDCEDYSLTVLHRIAGGSSFKFWFYLLTFQAVVWHCVTAQKEQHAQLWFRGQWIDNINSTWSKKQQHSLRFPYPFPLVAYRMLTSKLPLWVANTGLVAICSTPLVLELIK